MIIFNKYIKKRNTLIDESELIIEKNDYRKGSSNNFKKKDKNKRINGYYFKKKLNGFTFIEILIVITIIALLTSIVGVAYIQYLKKARVITAKTQIKNFEMALESFYIDNGFYPDTEQGLKALIEKPQTGKEAKNWNGPYLNSKKIPLDPWNNPYNYICPGIHNKDKYDLFTLGKDNIEGGEGENQDITNW